MENTRRNPRLREGVVLKDKMSKTRVVAVTRLYRDPQYDKVIKKRVQYAVHDEKNESHAGDRVRIVETRALSRTKRWRMIKLLEKAKL